MSSEALNQRFVYVPTSALIVSIALHVALPLFLLSVGVLENFGYSIFGKRAETKEVYQSYIQVDVVALPDALITEKVDTALPVVESPATAPEPEKAEDSMVEPTTKKETKPDPSIEKAKQEKKRLADQEKALKKLQAEANREAALKSLSGTKPGKAGRAKIAGNIVSKGTALQGAVGNEKDRYGALVTQRIKEHFRLYAWQKKKGLVAEVSLVIFPTGRVRERKLVKSSRDASYDAAVLQAVEAAQPLPVPDDLSLLSEAIIISFKPEE